VKLIDLKNNQQVVFAGPPPPPPPPAALVVLPPQGGAPHAVLLVGGQQLTPWCLGRPTLLALLAMAGANVRFVPGAIHVHQAQTFTTRLSYVKAVLVQRAGVIIPGGCNRCNSGAGYRPFTQCRFVRGFFHDACGNCIWRDHAARCRHGDDDEDGADDDNDSFHTAESGSDDDVVILDGPQRLLPVAGGMGNPIVL
jgi:hypothetical protein